ncbi:MAG TPA: L,D-transpeptidase [Symbiobacteriaceae bacterium]|nr:L,D-transpeptidase [Symbiobacteriaceae bacterium]
MSAYRRRRAKRRRGLVLALALIAVAAGTYTLREPLLNLIPSTQTATPTTNSPADPAAAAELAISPTLHLAISAQSDLAFQTGRTARLLAKTKTGWTEQAKLTLPNLPGDQVKITPENGSYIIEARQALGLRRAEVQVEGGKLRLLDYYSNHAPTPAVKNGSYLFVNKYLNQLWYFQDGKLAATYPVATGRQTSGPAPTMQDYMTNFFTPEGQYKIANKRVDPAYYGSAEHPAAVGGAPDNPLGPRWMGFGVLQGDAGNIWAIHGTNDPAKIGTWVSDGCIRMRPEDVTALFDRINVETTLQVVSGRT